MWMRLKFAGFFLVLASAPSGVMAADAANGQRIAERWCAACHVVSSGQQHGSADVPSFRAVGAKYADDARLRAFLTDPHPKMPDMSLAQPEIADLIAYIRSLGPPRRAPAPDGDDRPAGPPRG
jgi:mono/diheme cytochrome c family protein